MPRGGYREGSGRKPGSKNKRTLKIEQQLEKMESPFEGLSRVAKRAEEEGDLPTAARCYSELCSYVMAKPRAPEEPSAQPGLGMSLEELQAFKKRLLAGQDASVH